MYQKLTYVVVLFTVVLISVLYFDVFHLSRPFEIGFKGLGLLVVLLIGILMIWSIIYVVHSLIKEKTMDNSGQDTRNKNLESSEQTSLPPQPVNQDQEDRWFNILLVVVFVIIVSTLYVLSL